MSNHQRSSDQTGITLAAGSLRSAIPISRRDWLKYTAVASGVLIGGSHQLLRPSKAYAIDPAFLAASEAAASAAGVECVRAFIKWFVKTYFGEDFSATGKQYKRKVDVDGESNYQCWTSLPFEFDATPMALANDRVEKNEEKGFRAAFIPDASGRESTRTLRICPLEIPDNGGFMNARDLIKWGDIDFIEGPTIYHTDVKFGRLLRPLSPRFLFDETGKSADRQRSQMKELFKEEYGEEDPDEWFLKGFRQYHVTAGMISEGFELQNKRDKGVFTIAFSNHVERRQLIKEPLTLKG